MNALLGLFPLAGVAEAASARTGRSEAGRHTLVPDTLSDRGNAKLFVELYARGFRYVPGLGW
ncbi:hypothetical protein ABZ350_15990, partial [Streptomyces uncialis]